MCAYSLYIEATICSTHREKRWWRPPAVVPQARRRLASRVCVCVCVACTCWFLFVVVGVCVCVWSSRKACFQTVGQRIQQHVIRPLPRLPQVTRAAAANRAAEHARTQVSMHPDDTAAYPATCHTPAPTAASEPNNTCTSTRTNTFQCGYNY